MEGMFKTLMRTVGMICLIPIALFIWFYAINPPASTVTTTRTDILTIDSDLAEDTQDKTFVANINYYSNSKKDGRELFEIEINNYQTLSDAENAINSLNNSNETQVASYGIQIYDDALIKNVGIKNKFDFSRYKRTKKNVYYRRMKVADSNLYVQGGNGEEFINGNTTVDEFDNFLVSSDDSIYRLKFKDELVKKKYKTWIFGANKSYYNKMDINYFSFLLYDKISTLKTEDGTFFLTIDMSKIFDIEIYDQDKQEFAAPNSSENKNLLKFKINISSNGATKASQSIFKKINGDPDYNYFSLNEDNELFWKYINFYNITEKTYGLELRFSDVYCGNVIRISDELAAYLSQFDDMEISVELNLDSTNIVGLDSNFFNNLKIKNLKITSSTNINFYFLYNYDSTGNFEKIQHTENITLNFFNENKIKTEVING